MRLNDPAALSNLVLREQANFDSDGHDASGAQSHQQKLSSFLASRNTSAALAYLSSELSQSNINAQRYRSLFLDHYMIPVLHASRATLEASATELCNAFKEAQGYEIAPYLLLSITEPGSLLFKNLDLYKYAQGRTEADETIVTPGDIACNALLDFFDQARIKALTDNPAAIPQEQRLAIYDLIDISRRVPGLRALATRLKARCAEDPIYLALDMKVNPEKAIDLGLGHGQIVMKLKQLMAKGSEEASRTLSSRFENSAQYLMDLLGEGCLEDYEQVIELFVRECVLPYCLRGPEFAAQITSIVVESVAGDYGVSGLPHMMFALAQAPADDAIHYTNQRIWYGDSGASTKRFEEWLNDTCVNKTSPDEISRFLANIVFTDANLDSFAADPREYYSQREIDCIGFLLNLAEANSVYFESIYNKMQAREIDHDFARTVAQKFEEVKSAASEVTEDLTGIIDNGISSGLLNGAIREQVLERLSGHLMNEKIRPSQAIEHYVDGYLLPYICSDAPLSSDAYGTDLAIQGIGTFFLSYKEKMTIDPSPYFTFRALNEKFAKADPAQAEYFRRLKLDSLRRLKDLSSNHAALITEKSIFVPQNCSAEEFPKKFNSTEQVEYLDALLDRLDSPGPLRTIKSNLRQVEDGNWYRNSLKRRVDDKLRKLQRA